MSRKDSRANCVQPLARLIVDLDRIAITYRTVANAIRSGDDPVADSRPLGMIHARGLLEALVAHDHSLARDYDRTLKGDLARALALVDDLERALKPVLDHADALLLASRADALATTLEVRADAFSQLPTSTTALDAPRESGAGRRLAAKVEAQVLGSLAQLLPAGERARFVAEQQGNLGDCEHWRQRVTWLCGVAIATPRLALMVRPDGLGSGRLASPWPLLVIAIAAADVLWMVWPSIQRALERLYLGTG